MNGCLSTIGVAVPGVNVEGKKEVPVGSGNKRAEGIRETPLNAALWVGAFQSLPRNRSVGEKPAVTHIRNSCAANKSLLAGSRRPHS